MSEAICKEIELIIENELIKIKDGLPLDPVMKFALFTETIRVLDLRSIDSSLYTNRERARNLDILMAWWNTSTSFLFEDICVPGFPILESTKEFFGYATGLLYKLGQITTLKRAIDMARTWMISITREDDTYVFEKIQNTDSQYLDSLELTNLWKLEELLKIKIGERYNKWEVVPQNNIEKAFCNSGNYIAFADTVFQDWPIKDIDDLLYDQVYPWDSGHGVMAGYKSTSVIDIHFLSKASELVKEWIFEAGFHPKTRIGNITGQDLFIVLTFLTSFHLKHIHCVLVASKKHPEISMQQSLTIWGPLENLIDDIAGFSDIDRSIISEAFDSLAMKPEDVAMLEKHTSKFMPLMVDIWNGYVLRPISSILRNPLLTISHLLEHRNPNFINDISLHREEWLRNNLYAMFSGTRYATTDGNVDLATEGRTITDIDAAIFDLTTGELALFQIKWQDFFLNDVKKLRSRANNLTKSLDEWAKKVNDWMNCNGLPKLLQSLRLKSINGKTVENVYLFGISKNAARMQWYGFSTTTENLAVANWPQFQKNRFEIGPSERVFTDMFEALKKQEKDCIETIPFPTEFTIDNKTFQIKDFWSTYEDWKNNSII